MDRLINNAKWSSTLDGRMSEDDVCIEVLSSGSGAEIYLAFDSQEEATIKLSADQIQELITNLQTL
jgi:hypothetical protein